MQNHDTIVESSVDAGCSSKFPCVVSIMSESSYRILGSSRSPAKKAELDKLRDCQTVEIEGSNGARRFAESDITITRHFGDVNTVYEAFLRGLKLAGDDSCLGWYGTGPTYSWLTYNQVFERATKVGSGLVNIGCEPSQTTFVGIMSQNCPEWNLAEYGCMMHSMVLVPIYDTHGQEACAHIINQASLENVFCHGSKIPILTSIVKECECLKRIVKLDSACSEEEKAECTQLGIELISLSELEEFGNNNETKRRPPRPEDIFTVCYTSGTTGVPKGAVLTHDQVISDLSGLAYHNKRGGMEMVQTDVHLSYLPLAHMMERAVQVALFSVGGKIGYYRGDPKLLLEDMQKLQPTLFITVPRLLNRINDKVMAGLSESKAKAWLFQKAMNSKEADLKRGIIRNDTFWDYLVFRKVQKLLGGKLRWIVCGSAPLSSKVMTFTRCVMGCMVMEGYGQTECTAAVTFTLPNDFTTGHVGSPIPCNQIKLVDVPEMEYFTEKFQGEVCVKGANVFKEYYKMPEKTADTIDKDGWIHTGDIGEWLPNGTLKIIDRKKHIFKLAQGEYIAPEKIQNVYLRSRWISQVFITGDSQKSFVVAIVVPDFEVLVPWAKAQGHEITGTDSDCEKLAKNEDIKKMILQDMVTHGKEGKLNSFEQVKTIHLHSEPFGIENGLLTPTLKSKRPALQKMFEAKLIELYEEIENKSAQPAQ